MSPCGVQPAVSVSERGIRNWSIDNEGHLRFIQAGFLGSTHDSTAYRLMTPVGHGRQLSPSWRYWQITDIQMILPF